MSEAVDGAVTDAGIAAGRAEAMAEQARDDAAAAADQAGAAVDLAAGAAGAAADARIEAEAASDQAAATAHTLDSLGVAVSGLLSRLDALEAARQGSGGHGDQDDDQDDDDGPPAPPPKTKSEDRKPAESAQGGDISSEKVKDQRSGYGSRRWFGDR